MQHKRAIAPFRLPRAIAWMQAMLAFLAALLSGKLKNTSAARRRARGFIGCRLDFLAAELARLALVLIFIRAAEMAPRRAKRQPGPPGNALPGFKRRARPRGPRLVRACIGATLRRSLRANGVLARIARIAGALANIDAHAAALAPRLKRGLSRLCPLVLVHAFADALNAAPARHAPCADTS